MTIGCPGCGRPYDESLLRDGRTIWCTCGSRVGVTCASGITDGPVRFLTDGMLTGLARWLRLLGFDCAESGGASDAALVRQAVEERRYLLTRDRGLAQDWRVAHLHVVDSGEVRSQLLEIVHRFGLAGAIDELTRCGRCNVPIEAVVASEVRDRLPERVLELHREFTRCPRCGRVYWEGTQAAQIRRVADELRRETGGETGRA